MSWQQAQREARHWIDGLNLQKVRGRLIDLREPAKLLKFQEGFRIMVLRAAERLLKVRGAATLLPDDLLSLDRVDRFMTRAGDLKTVPLGKASAIARENQMMGQPILPPVPAERLKDVGIRAVPGSGDDGLEPETEVYFTDTRETVRSQGGR